VNWDCHNCTLCCRLFALGPVAPEIVAGLQARGIEQDWAPAADGWVDETPQGLFLTHRDDSCVFLRDDGLCAVHALYGPEAKPAFCRTFPFTVVEQAGGVVHAVREDCGGTWRSLIGGTPASQAIEALPDQAPRLVWGDEPVQVLPGVGIAGDDWLALEDHLVAQVRDDLDPQENLCRLRDALLGALRRAPPDPDPARSAACVEGLRQNLAAALGPAASPADAQGTAARFLAGVATGLAAAAPGHAAVAPLAPDAERYFALVIRQHLRGKAFRASGAVCWGLGLVSLGVALARARTPKTDLAALAPWHVRWSRFTRNQGARALLHQHRDTLWEALLHR